MSDYHRNNDLAVEMHVPDFSAVKMFYGALGFEIEREESPSAMDTGFLLLRLGNTRLQFHGGDARISKHHFFSQFSDASPPGYRVEFVIPVDDIRAVFARAQAAHPDAIVAVLKQREWLGPDGADFRMKDPNGFYLRFTS